jgi:hypothetical protein
LEYLLYRGLFVWRNNAAPIPTRDGGYRRFNGMKGRPDIEGILEGGRYFGCEIKKPGGKMSAAQNIFHQRAAALGGFLCTVHSVDELEQDLQEIL